MGPPSSSSSPRHRHQHRRWNKTSNRLAPSPSAQGIMITMITTTTCKGMRPTCKRNNLLWREHLQVQPLQNQLPVPAFWAFWSPINCKRAPDQQNFFEQTKTSYIASLSIFVVSTFRTCDYLQIKTSSEFQPSQNKTKTSH